MDLTDANFLNRLAARGVTLSARDGALSYDAPKGALTPDLLAELRRRKAGLLAHLDGAEKAPPSKRFSIAGERPAHAPLVDPQWTPANAFHRLVEPYKGYLLNLLNLDKRFVRAEGVFMEDADGVRYLDFLAQYGALPFGHHPEDVWRAINSVRTSGAPAFAANSELIAAGELAEALLALWPEAGFSNVVFANSGAEAVEAAIKLCRAATGRKTMISAANGFHGLTLGALSVGGNPIYRDGFVDETPNMVVPFGDFDALERAFAAHLRDIAGFIVEPIQGEGGVNDAPEGYLSLARALCDRHGALLVIDEVQTGLGRTGAMFASMRSGCVPDIMPLGKALGGGLLPIGACLYRPSARSERFGLRHASTFAAGSLACRAALATIALLNADGGALLKAVEANGRRLHAGLLGLKEKYPQLVSDVSGAGYLQGIKLGFEALKETPGLLGILHDQSILCQLAVSYLLNVERVRVAPAFGGGDVIRVEPPLIATASHCDRFIEALDRTLGAVAGGDAIELLRPLLKEAPAPVPRAQASPRRPAPTGGSDVGRFAFIVHPIDQDDYARIDPNLKRLPAGELRRLMRLFARFVDPVLVESVEIVGARGARAIGDLIMIPYTAEDLMMMDPLKAVAEVELAVRVAQRRGAQVVGLGAFTSIVTQGGMALEGRGLPALTSGNSFTASAAKETMLAAARARGLDPARAKVAIVGAGGMIGRAASLLLSHEFGSLLLVGNTTIPDGYRKRMRIAAQRLRSEIIAAAALRPPGPECLASAVLQQDGALEAEGLIEIGESLDEALPSADVILLATNSIDRFLLPRHLKPGAIVCDVSRPFNIDPSVERERPDVRIIEGGLVALPPGCSPSAFTGPAPGVVFACAAETMLWALERAYDRVSPTSCMEFGAVLDLERFARAHSFSVIGERQRP